MIVFIFFLPNWNLDILLPKSNSKSSTKVIIYFKSCLPWSQKQCPHSLPVSHSCMTYRHCSSVEVSMAFALIYLPLQVLQHWLGLWHLGHSFPLWCKLSYSFQCPCRTPTWHSSFLGIELFILISFSFSTLQFHSTHFSSRSMWSQKLL